MPRHDMDEDDDWDHHATRRRRSAPAPLPTLCTVVFILDIVFDCFRGLAGLLGIVGLAALRQQGNDALARTGVFEVGASFLVAFFGIVAALCLLMKQRWALTLGYVVAVLTLGAIGIAAWQLVLMINAPGNHPPGFQAGIALGGGFSILVRVALLGLYLFALAQFSKWADENSED